MKFHDWSQWCFRKISTWIELQYDPILGINFRQEALITSYASLPASRFSKLRKLPRNLADVFGITCTYKQAFSYMK